MKILVHLSTSGLVDPIKTFQSGKPTKAILTAERWSAADRLRSSRPGSTQAFVAMSFDSDLVIAWELGLQPALIECGYTPWRSDKEEFNEKICDRIIVEIRRSGVLIADVTQHRQGVYFEAGYAMGHGIPVLWTCKESELKDAHFDTRQYNHLCWIDHSDLREKLVHRVKSLFPLKA